MEETRYDPFVDRGTRDCRTRLARRFDGVGPGAAASANVVLPVSVLPPQLLAGLEPAVPGSQGQPVHATAGIHGVPAVQRAGLALRNVVANEVLPWPSLLAGPVLNS